MAKTIITLSREYCTGGRYIAQDVADALGIYAVDQTGSMRVAEVQLPRPAAQQTPAEQQPGPGPAV